MSGTLNSPPMPKGVGSLRVLKQMYRDWLADGGYPPIYWDTVPPGVSPQPPDPPTSGSNTSGAFDATAQTDLIALLQADVGVVGGFDILIDGTSYAISHDFSLISSMAGIAALIDQSLNPTPRHGSCTWNGALGSFVITSATTGLTSTVAYATTPAGRANYSATFKLTAASGAVLVGGAARRSLGREALAEAQQTLREGQWVWSPERNQWVWVWVP